MSVQTEHYRGKSRFAKYSNGQRERCEADHKEADEGPGQLGITENDTS